MPLRITCGKCKRELILDEAFRGAYCRCRHCRSLIHVPPRPDYSAKKPADRLAQPPLAVERTAAPQSEQTVVETKEKPRTNTFSQRVLNGIPKPLRSPVAVAAMVCLAASLLAVTAWRISSPHPPEPLSQVVRSDASAAPIRMIPRATPTNDPLQRLAVADPTTTYFGFPTTGKTIGYIVDGDGTMAPYIDDLSFVTNKLNEAMEPGTCRVGVVMATGHEGHTVLEVVLPTSDLVGAVAVLTSRLPGGRTDLSKALQTTYDWYADTLFLILAKPIGDQEFAILTENAEQTGAVTNVIGLGEATKQDLSPIASATGGELLRLDDDALNDWVARAKRQ